MKNYIRHIAMVMAFACAGALLISYYGYEAYPIAEVFRKLMHTFNIVALLTTLR